MAKTDHLRTNIRSYMKAHELSADELSRKAGGSESLIRNLMYNSDSTPRENRLKMIAKALGVSVEALTTTTIGFGTKSESKRGRKAAVKQSELENEQPSDIANGSDAAPLRRRVTSIDVDVLALALRKCGYDLKPKDGVRAAEAIAQRYEQIQEI